MKLKTFSPSYSKIVFNEPFLNVGCVSSNGGVITGTPTIDGYFQGNGLTDYVTYADDFVPQDGDFSLSCFVTTPFTSNAWAQIVSKGQTSAGMAGGFGILQRSTEVSAVSFLISNQAGGSFVANIPSGTLSDGKHHILATRIGAVANLYVDGVLVGTDASASAILDTKYPVLIGGNGTTYSDAKIEKVLIHNVGLTAEEAKDLYEKDTYSELERPLIDSPLRSSYYKEDGTELLVDGDMEDLETYGVELVTNGDFSAWTDPTVPDGWGKSGTHDANNYVEESPAGKLHLVSDGTLIGIVQAILTVGKRYRISFDVDTLTTDGFKIVYSAAEEQITSTGSYSFAVVADGANFIIYRRYAGTACDITLDNLSVKEITGGTANWNTGNSPIISSVTASPEPGNALRITRNGTDTPYVFQSFILSIGKRYRITGKTRGDGSSYVTFGGSCLGSPILNTADWQSFDFTALASASMVGLFGYGLSGSEYVEFDDVSVEQVEAHTENKGTLGGTAILGGGVPAAEPTQLSPHGVQGSSLAYISHANPSFMNGASEFTFMCLAQVTLGSYKPFFCKGNLLSYQASVLARFENDKKLYFTFNANGSSTDSAVYTTRAIQKELTNRWHTFGFVFSPGSAKIYIDGVEEPTTTRGIIGSTLSTNSYDLNILRYWSMSHIGKMDRYIATDSAYTPSQVRKLHHDLIANLNV